MREQVVSSASCTTTPATTSVGEHVQRLSRAVAASAIDRRTPLPASGGGGRRLQQRRGMEHQEPDQAPARMQGKHLDNISPCSSALARLNAW